MSNNSIIKKYMNTYSRKIDPRNNKYSSPSYKERATAYFTDVIDDYENTLKKVDAKGDDVFKEQEDEIDKERAICEKKYSDIAAKYADERNEIGIVYRYIRKTIQSLKQDLNKARSSYGGGKSRKQRGGKKGRGSSRRR